MTAPDSHQLSLLIKQKARELGFDLAGIAPPDPSAYRNYFRQWLDDGKAGTMDYLHARFDERTDPAVYMPGVQSIICLAINYQVTLAPSDESALQGKIARYALGNDYHEVLKKRLHALADWMRQAAPGAQTRCSVDSAPVMEKELAARAGVGWIGKNTCVINPEIGSWLVLGEVLTDLPLPFDAPAIDRCGTCRRCIDACPTGAINEPYQLDARKCISYLTIEHRQEIPAEFHEKLNGWIFGCDICQDVCPWNRRAPESDDVDFAPRFEAGAIPLGQLIEWTPDDYRQALRHSAIKRVKLPVLQRNARLLLKQAAQ